MPDESPPKRSSLPPTTSSPHRLYHLDNLRTSLTGLVILHHVSVPYGGLGLWPYQSRFHNTGSSPSLVVFNAVNQSFFMGSFFFLSGIMSSTSLRRRWTEEFLRTKWMKLGIPVVVSSLLGPPFQTAIQRLFEGKVVGWDILVTHLKGLTGVKGSVWYPAVLMVFDTLYTIMPKVPRLSFGPAMSLNILAAFLLRLKYPTGTTLAPLNVQPGYLPQYIISYLLGTITPIPTGDTPSLLTRRQMKTLLGASIASGVSMLVLVRSYPLSSMNGGWNWLALAYAMWNETTGAVIASVVLDTFRKSSWATKKWSNIGEYSYAAFLVHQPVCITIQYALDGWEAGGVVKTIVVGGVGVVGSWLAGWGLTLIPGFRKIIV
ncbi:acyltransferase 3 [Glarea lozoyensis ATCC 20868]|uniref:Acyltransferase 3 n=1 Tax=Glarea lozoyensis (strain ATCC 20868 / MF5171) TaxID=1116229 RepID=S3DD51_GLAL2|nr:acyltransferase 3 [Glarea lozoyensis ATCC 20868]EPE35660.1 acyltransferase 3 [Glarea lozoyensis ATCC 20868]